MYLYNNIWFSESFAISKYQTPGPVVLNVFFFCGTCPLFRDLLYAIHCLVGKPAFWLVPVGWVWGHARPPGNFEFQMASDAILGLNIT